jgi:hypothetical protein
VRAFEALTQQLVPIHLGPEPDREGADRERVRPPLVVIPLVADSFGSRSVAYRISTSTLWRSGAIRSIAETSPSRYRFGVSGSTGPEVQPISVTARASCSATAVMVIACPISRSCDPLLIFKSMLSVVLGGEFDSVFIRVFGAKCIVSV